MRCCTRDEGAGPVGLVALRGRPAGGGRKPPRGASVKSRGAERRGKGSRRAGQVWITKASESDTTRESVESVWMTSKPRSSRCLGMSLAGACRLARWCPALEVARAWSGLSCGTREPVAPMGRPASGAVLSCGRSSGARTPSSGNCEGESSDAGHRGGPSRISGEGPVMGLERRGRVVLAGLAVNHLRVGGAG